MNSRQNDKAHCMDDSKIVSGLLEQVARNSVAIENLSRVIADVVESEERKRYMPILKELLSSNFALQTQIGELAPEYHPMFSGLLAFSQLRKKYEDPNHPISLPSQEDIENAKRLWSKMRRAE